MPSRRPGATVRAACESPIVLMFASMRGRLNGWQRIGIVARSLRRPVPQHHYPIRLNQMRQDRNFDLRHCHVICRISKSDAVPGPASAINEGKMTPIRSRTKPMRRNITSAFAGALLLGLGTPAALAVNDEFSNKCAMGLASGHDIQTDCSINMEIQGKTYCFGSKEAMTQFMADPTGNLAKA